jgi:hypothetical protein
VSTALSATLSATLFAAALSSDEYCTAYLDKQLAWYREYGLPLPPPQAALVWYVTKPTTAVIKGKLVVEPGSPGLGFSLDGRSVLYGASRSEPVPSITFIKPDPSLVREGIYIHWLRFAVACHERGWKPMALAALRKWVCTNGWDSEEDIARDSWNHWVSQIHDEPGTPLPVLLKYLKRAQRLNGGGEELIRSVELAVKPRNSPPGSDDALLDELINLSGEEPFTDFLADPRYRAVARRGLEIVPVLIAHLSDERITRTVRLQGGIGNSENLRVRDIVLDFLTQLHGGPFAVPEDTWDERLKAIGNWFADAHKLGEGKYVASRILGAEKDDNEFRPMLFWLLTEKYPERVPGVYRALIDTRSRQHRFAWRYAKAVAEGPLPVADKRKILEYAAIQDSPTIRWGGIKYLRAVDPELAHGILLAALAKLPTEADARESYLAMVAAEGTDPDEWRALGLAVRRADPGGRLELLQAVAFATAPEGRKHRLAFLAEYLSDDAVRDADATPRRLEVGNFAALRLANLLKIDAEPTEDWTAAQWAELRAKVRAKVNEELQR